MRTRGWIVGAAALAALAGGTWWARHQGAAPVARRTPESGRVAVEAHAVTHGPVADVRQFTGTLEASDAFTVAPKTGGQIEQVHVDIGDRVHRGQIVVEMDDDEARQAVAEAQAELSVSKAQVEQAQADARLAERELERTRTLAQRDLASQSELDTTQAKAEAQRAAVAVARANVTQRKAALARARVQLGYTDVRANWPGQDEKRVVGQRMVNAGDTVAANTPLLTVLRIDPLTAVAHASESDYPLLSKGETATVTADALPGRTFSGHIAREAPRFASDSRQARFEVSLPNRDRALKPGMFVTVRVQVDHAANATLVPREAIVRRQAGPGVYQVVDGSPPTVKFVPVQIGIDGGKRVQITQPDLSGQVVTLGQQMLEDGTPVILSRLPES